MADKKLGIEPAFPIEKTIGTGDDCLGMTKRFITAKDMVPTAYKDIKSWTTSQLGQYLGETEDDFLK